MAHRRNDSRAEQSIIEYVANAQIARYRDVSKQGEIGRPLVHNLDLIVAVSVAQQVLFTRHCEIQPTLRRRDVMRTGLQSTHGVESSAASDV